MFTHGRPTGYDRRGVCVPLLTSPEYPWVINHLTSGALGKKTLIPSVGKGGAAGGGGGGDSSSRSKSQQPHQQLKTMPSAVLEDEKEEKDDATQIEKDAAQIEKGVYKVESQVSTTTGQVGSTVVGMASTSVSALSMGGFGNSSGGSAGGAGGGGHDGGGGAGEVPSVPLLEDNGPGDPSLKRNLSAGTESSLTSGQRSKSHSKGRKSAPAGGSGKKLTPSPPRKTSSSSSSSSITNPTPQRGRFPIKGINIKGLVVERV